MVNRIKVLQARDLRKDKISNVTKEWDKDNKDNKDPKVAKIRTLLPVHKAVSKVRANKARADNKAVVDNKVWKVINPEAVIGQVAQAVPEWAQVKEKTIYKNLIDLPKLTPVVPNLTGSPGLYLKFY